MNESIFKSIEDFNKDIIGIDRKPGPLPKDELEWLNGAVGEEMGELAQAHENGDFVGQIDAVIDAMYFLGGALTRMGIDHAVSEEIFTAIHCANMLKHKGKKDRDIQHENDAVKPITWVDPESRIIDILESNYGKV